MLGKLPDHFLRIQPSAEQAAQIAADQQVALSLQRQIQAGQPMAPTVPSNIIGRLDLTIIEARLVKNYGLARMDPYVRLRVGHQVYETRTAVNGARNPVWNKVSTAVYGVLFFKLRQFFYHRSRSSIVSCQKELILFTSKFSMREHSMKTKGSLGCIIRSLRKCSKARRRKSGSSWVVNMVMVERDTSASSWHSHRSRTLLLSWTLESSSPSLVFRSRLIWMSEPAWYL